jgi:hypothetical protein
MGNNPVMFSDSFNRLIVAGRILRHSTGTHELASPVAQFMRLAERGDFDRDDIQDDPDEIAESRMNPPKERKILHE